MRTALRLAGITLIAASILASAVAVAMAVATIQAVQCTT